MADEAEELLVFHAMSKRPDFVFKNNRQFQVPVFGVLYLLNIVGPRFCGTQLVGPGAEARWILIEAEASYKREEMQ